MRVVTQSRDQDSAPHDDHPAAGGRPPAAPDAHRQRLDGSARSGCRGRTDTMVVRGAIQSTLYDAIDAGAPRSARPARAELAWSVADIFEYRVDMSRDLQMGDDFHVLVRAPQRAAGHRADRDASWRPTFTPRRRSHIRPSGSNGRTVSRVLRPGRQVDAGDVPARAAGVPPHLERLRHAQAPHPRHLASAHRDRLRRQRGNPRAQRRRWRRDLRRPQGRLRQRHRHPARQRIRDALRAPARLRGGRPRRHARRRSARRSPTSA